MDDLIEQKIQELIDIAKALGDNNTVVVMLTLQASKLVGYDSLVAKHCQKVGSELLERINNDQQRSQAMLN